MKLEDKILDRLNSIDKTLAAQHVSLKDHIRRTEILEKQIEPLKSSLDMIKGVFKFIALVGVIATIIEVIHWGLK